MFKFFRVKVVEFPTGLIEDIGYIKREISRLHTRRDAMDTEIARLIWRLERMDYNYKLDQLREDVREIRAVLNYERTQKYLRPTVWKRIKMKWPALKYHIHIIWGRYLIWRNPPVVKFSECPPEVPKNWIPPQ